MLRAPDGNPLLSMPYYRFLSVIAVSLLLFPLLSIAQEQTFEAGHKAYSEGDYTQAYLAFKTAAENGDDRAFGRLGGMYLYGVGTERSFDNAYLWFTLAHASGDKYAGGFQRTAAAMLKPARIGELQAEAQELQRQLGIVER